MTELTQPELAKELGFWPVTANGWTRAELNLCLPLAAAVVESEAVYCTSRDMGI